MFRKGFTLEQLERSVAFQETVTGSLRSLGMTEDSTLAVYARNERPNARVQLTADPVPDGYKTIWRGTVWIENRRQTITAMRKD